MHRKEEIMKKRIALILAASMLTAMLAGCGENPDDIRDRANEETASSETVSSAETGFKSLIGENVDAYVTLGEYKSLSADYVVEEPTEEEIQDRINSDLASKTEVKDVSNRPVKDGDIVNIDYCGKKDGVVFDGGTAQGYDLTIGSHSFIEGFEDGLIGKKKGETVDLNLTFPEEYHSEELAGADVVFTVSINSISENIVPVLDNKLAAEFNPDCKTVDEYKNAIKESILSENRVTARENAAAQLLSIAVTNATFKEIPQWLIDEKIDFTNRYLDSMLQYYNITKEDMLAQEGITEEQFNERNIASAEADARNNLVVYAIAEKEGLLLTDEELKSELEIYMNYYGVTDIDEYLKTSDGIESAYYVQTNRVLDFIFENAKLD